MDFPTLIDWMSPFPILGLFAFDTFLPISWNLIFGWAELLFLLLLFCYYFYSHRKRASCKKTVGTLNRYRILQLLIWVFNLSMSHKNGTWFKWFKGCLGSVHFINKWSSYNNDNHNSEIYSILLNPYTLKMSLGGFTVIKIEYFTSILKIEYFILYSSGAGSLVAVYCTVFSFSLTL